MEIKRLKNIVTTSSLDKTLTNFWKDIRNQIRTDIKAELTAELDILKQELTDEKNKVKALVSERDKLKDEMLNFAKRQNNLDNEVRAAVIMGNNEQYSRKRNIKLLGMKENENENLRNDFKKLVTECASMNIPDNQIVAIHRSDTKTDVMKNRQGFKGKGLNIFDNVTKRNSELINRLKNNSDIYSAWYFNGKIYARSTLGKRYSFELYENIKERIAASTNRARH
ncbi:hypothetical protein LOTGIDRAFT_161017 [Lottia gigantea]|uniref:Uncharacterized protein n=1 Tax=Lottia gigantea TaxID=225164 RepID=V3ZTH9_LOTGI|nr:hypothetical protein LOTGIDRAFT_161017 [Lottia gigantea]ESO94768.1 hypothetical protein LOTGIDRAFT_161017 [Lottia gigantea]